MADEFEGFANDPVDKDGNRVNPADVDRYVDETDAGKAREESQTTQSSIVKFKSEGKGTNGAPAAVVPAPSEADEAPADEDDASDDNPDADAAGGEEAKES